jgi:hypothetical protein
VAVLSFPSSPVGRRAGYGSKEEDHRVSDGFEIGRVLQIVSIVTTSAL